MRPASISIDSDVHAQSPLDGRAKRAIQIPPNRLKRRGERAIVVATDAGRFLIRLVGPVTRDKDPVNRFLTRAGMYGHNREREQMEFGERALCPDS